eukprot:TRINITY_DN5656_c0_g1_i1.p1 TRINITY_DN5656_c0_g1~~TRINITY_DN5656_c0_g1_i1.p1  ORF type:complete len:585 (-),score=118.24 TRINITY_DN5656_c0_g1_i1:1633-3387(-)
MMADKGETDIFWAPKDVADYLVQTLVEYGVRRVYGYLGAAVVPILDRVKEHEGVIEFVLVRNEANASLAASADAKLTGGLGVCVATSGPGASNLVTGVIDAHFDRAPMLVITGDLATPKRGCPLEFQQLMQSTLFHPVVAQSMDVSHALSFPDILREAIGKALSERDAVHISIPVDVQRCAANHPAFARRAPFHLLRNILPGRFTDELFWAVWREIKDAAYVKKSGVAIVVGQRARGCGELIERLSESIPAPILTSLDAKGIIDESHKNCIGVLGIFGSPASELSQEVLQDVHLIVAVGLDNPTPFVARQQGQHQQRDLINVDVDFSSMAKHFTALHTLIGPLGVSLSALVERAAGDTTKEANNQERLLQGMLSHKASFYPSFLETALLSNDKFVHPVHVLHCINKFLAARQSTVVVPDVGDNTVWFALFLTLTRREIVINSTNMGIMGWCLPGAIACKLASPQSTVIAVSGDGGLQMTMNELCTAVQCRTSILVVVFNNTELKRVSGPFTHIFSPDFAAVAKACGADGETLARNDPALVEAAVARAFAHVDANKGPFVLNVTTDPKLAAPMSSWKTSSMLCAH